MIETRLDMQRAKRQSFARAPAVPEEPAAELAVETSPTVTAADDVAAMMDADPLQA